MTTVQRLYDLVEGAKRCNPATAVRMPDRRIAVTNGRILLVADVAGEVVEKASSREDAPRGDLVLAQLDRLLAVEADMETITCGELRRRWNVSRPGEVLANTPVECAKCNGDGEIVCAECGNAEECDECTGLGETRCGPPATCERAGAVVVRRGRWEPGKCSPPPTGCADATLWGRCIVDGCDCVVVDAGLMLVIVAAIAACDDDCPCEVGMTEDRRMLIVRTEGLVSMVMGMNP